MGLWRTLGRSRFARSIAPACDGLITVSEARGWGWELTMVYGVF